QNADLRNENTKFECRLLAEVGDPVKQVATLSFVHERNEGVADFQFNRVYLKQVFHEVAAGRRALDNRLWPAACCLTPLTILCGCPCYQREQTRECDKRKLGQPRN